MMLTHILLYLWAIHQPDVHPSPTPHPSPIKLTPVTRICQTKSGAMIETKVEISAK